MQTLMASINPEIFQKLKLAIELGKWADGSKLSKAQIESSLQAVIAYESVHLPEQQRTGFLPTKHLAQTNVENRISLLENVK